MCTNKCKESAIMHQVTKYKPLRMIWYREYRNSLCKFFHGHDFISLDIVCYLRQWFWFTWKNLFTVYMQVPSEQLAAHLLLWFRDRWAWSHWIWLALPCLHSWPYLKVSRSTVSHPRYQNDIHCRRSFRHVIFVHGTEPRAIWRYWTTILTSPGS